MERIFVSYSRTNLDVVTQAIQDLKAVGIEAWHDQTLTGGQRWWNNILSRIRDCEIFIFALSPESLESEACRGELGYAAQLGKTILPLLVADGINLNLLSPRSTKYRSPITGGVTKRLPLRSLRRSTQRPQLAHCRIHLQLLLQYLFRI
jgi:TIR domain